MSWLTPEYQNIFTQVQVQGQPEWGMDDSGNARNERGTWASFSTLLGWFGNAQLGPIYLGWTGIISIVTGTLALNERNEVERELLVARIRSGEPVKIPVADRSLPAQTLTREGVVDEKAKDSEAIPGGWPERGIGD